MSQPVKEMPVKEMIVSISAIIKAMRALADLLSEETRFMDGMLINKVDELQERKLKLATLLERYTRHLAKNPGIFANVTPEERRELQKTDEYYRRAIKANHEKLLVARAVNKSIVACVTRQAIKGVGNNIYNARGAMYNTYRMPVSMTLNRMI